MVVKFELEEVPTRFDEILTHLQQGAEVHIHRNVAVDKSYRINLIAEPDESAVLPRILGMHPGAMVMSPDFNDPLPDDFWVSGNP